MNKVLMCDPSLLAKDLSGKLYIVTGANSGIGFETTRQLTKQGAKVILACRRIEQAEKAIERIKAQGVDDSLLHTLALDLSSLKSVRHFADNFLKRYPTLDGLINNAGIYGFTDRGTSEQGFERTFAVNYYGHFLLTYLLMDRLKQSAPSRIINISSASHDMHMGKEGSIHFDDLHFNRRKYDFASAYSQSKLANLLHAQALARQLEGSGVTCVSLHPGFVYTEIFSKSRTNGFVQKITRAGMFLSQPVLRLIGMISPWQGVQTTLHCLLDDNIPQYSGQFFSQMP